MKMFSDKKRVENALEHCGLVNSRVISRAQVVAHRTIQFCLLSFHKKCLCPFLSHSLLLFLCKRTVFK